MREIKFRAWDEENAVMRKPFGFERIKCDPEEYDDDDSLPRVRMPDGWWTPLEQLQVMQYTGLKDKNGMEIYEGDIVRQTHVYADSQIGDVRYHAELGDACGWKCGPTFYLSSMQKEIEVIGNIYEHPELLK